MEKVSPRRREEIAVGTGLQMAEQSFVPCRSFAKGVTRVREHEYAYSSCCVEDAG